MKKITVLFLSLLLLFTFISCDEEKEIKGEDNKKTENVGKIEEKKVPTPDEEYVLYKETYTKTGAVKLYEYNDKGHLTRVTHNYPDGRTEEDLYEYTYNDDGSYSMHQDGYLITEKTSEYDSNGRLTKETDSRYTSVFTYGDNTVECKKTNTDGATVNWYVETLDEDGRIIKHEDFAVNGESFGYILFIYDENGNETAQEKYTPEGEKNGGNAVYEWTEEYDEYGRITRKVKGVPATGGYAREELYEYDENGGMCKMTVGSTIYEYRPLSECEK
jgi:hypothetical protein